MKSKIKYKIGELKTVYDGDFLQIKQRELVFSNGKKKIFEYCLRPDSVTMLPFDEKGRLLLIREYRYEDKKYEWFLPAGSVNKGEKPLTAAKRELQEEVGYNAKKWKKIFRRPSGSNFILWHVHVYVAEDLFVSKKQGDEEFEIEVVPTPLKKAVKMALDGTIENEFIAYHIIRFNELKKSNRV
ncbi:MAG: NUDIX hydrolase [Candidatus Magasanikbacteria bacterium GW2011_GWC2_34_16]|uniref:NUDIX hydrolase n=2 Tax=Candidatus Magasanikiibacteriota TaxID=1752731 RepID=A0A0G0H7Y1_9BACT|nr:MAG: NUDIX hydrolase [Candidatus Magasanikbacteria bacterium GW2011_GWC2_34_16]KKQ39373.1 MAG: NUDIX hydrolase [Candidatus Magasanikbacteria bacterium GW2011_GWA2_37_8]